VRLRAALEALPGQDLTQLALDLGYSSHSHFSERFRQVYGRTPSEFRRAASGHHRPS
jgi:AraC-like DNA-binding protein